MRSKKEQGIILKKLGDFYQQLKEFEKAGPKLARVQILNLSTVCSIALGETYSELNNDEKPLICFRQAKSNWQKKWRAIFRSQISLEYVADISKTWPF